MKHFFLFAFSFFSFFANADPGDTLGITVGFTPRFSPGPGNQVTIPTYQGGYAFGVNYDPNNNFIGIGQGYLNDSPVNIVGILSFIGAKQKGVNNVPDTKITFKLHSMSTSGAYNIIPSPVSLEPTNGPSVTVLASKSLFFEEIDTSLGSLNYVAFDAPVAVPGNMVATVDLLEVKTAGDIVGFFTDVPGDALGINFAFHQANVAGDIMWFTSNTVFQGALDVNIGIFPVIEPEPSNSILETSKQFQGVRALAMPNPANEELQIDLQLSETAYYKVQLMNSKGQQVRAFDLGVQNPGVHTVKTNIVDLEAGTYFYSVINDKGVRFCRAIIIAH